MKKIFISGAGGYIGSNLATFLSKKNYYLFCLTTKKKIRLKNTKWIVGKMSHNCAKYLKKSDLLIHCAAAGVYKKESKKNLNKVNYLDSINLLKNAYECGCKNWIILGSSFEYGFIKNKPLSAKKTKIKPIDDYGKSKVRLFKAIKKLEFSRSCRILYLRVFHVFGGNEPKKRMYPSLLRALKNNSFFKMTNGEEIRDFIHIDNVVKKIQSSFKMFNNKNFFKIKHLASGKKMRVKDFAKKIREFKRSNTKLLFGAVKKKNKYHSMYSDRSSIL